MSGYDPNDPYERDGDGGHRDDGYGAGDPYVDRYDGREDDMIPIPTVDATRAYDPYGTAPQQQPHGYPHPSPAPYSYGPPVFAPTVRTLCLVTHTLQVVIIKFNLKVMGLSHLSL